MAHPPQWAARERAGYMRTIGLRCLVVLLFFSFPLFAQQSEVVHVTAIELMIDVRDANGNIPQDLKPSDFVVVENGVQHQVSALDYLRNARVGTGSATGEAIAETTKPIDANVVVYIDLELSGTRMVRDALEGIIDRTADLTAVGPVDVVVTNPEIQFVLRESRDPRAVAAALKQVEQMPAHDRLVEHRRSVIGDSQLRMKGGGNFKNAAPAFPLMQLRQYVSQEERLIDRFHMRLLQVAGRYRRRSINAMFLVGEGFDLDPMDFYENWASDDDASQLRGEVANRIGAKNNAVARAMAAAGWTLSTLLGGVIAQFRDDAATSGNGKVAAFTNGNKALTTLIAHPRDPLLDFATETGGTIANEPAKFAQTIASLGERIRLTYEVPRAADGKPRRIEVRALRPGLKVQTTHWTSSTTPELTATSRVLEQFDANAPQGELPISAQLRLENAQKRGTGHGTLEVRLGLQPIAQLRPQLTATTLRVSIAVASKDNPPTVVHQTIDHYDLSKLQRVLYTAPIDLDKDATRVSVAAEELTSGAWGATALDLNASQRTFASKNWDREDAGQHVEESDGIAWMDWKEGLARAQAEKKLVFIDPGQAAICLGCRASRTVFRHPAFQRQMSTNYVPVKGPSLLPAGARAAIADPWGHILFSWRESADTVLIERLALAQKYANTLIAAGAVLSSGEKADAHFSLGYVYANTAEPEAAREHYARARDLARKEGDAAFAQRAEIHLALLDARSGSTRKSAAQALERIIASPRNDANAAEALIVFGNLQKANGDEKAAVEAFSRAAVRAPKGSELERAALTLSGAAVAPVVVADGEVRLLKPIQLMRPKAAVLSGSVRVQTLVRDARVDKVTFSLDDRVVDTDTEPPFSLLTDLGDAVRPHTFRAQAFSRDGKLLGEDVLPVNQRHDAFALKIASPRGGAAKGTTRIDVEIQRPATATIERVEYYWNEEKIATVREAPYTANVALPDRPGYIRAVAVLADGRAAEDAVTLNLSGYSENIDVQVVESYVRVTDAKGRALTGLDASNFTVLDVLDKGVPQELVRVEYVDRPPLHIGVALDVSSSMREEFLDAQIAAEDFLRDALASDAKAFVVAFQETPQLLHETSSDAESITKRISAATPQGVTTAVYDAVMFSLLQFEGTKGKKVLVVVTDADDRSSRYTYEQAIDVAKKTGVTIYAIVMTAAGVSSAPAMGRYSIPRRNDFDNWDAQRREIVLLAEETGGKTFFLNSGHNLPSVYREIDEHLGSHYLVAFRPDVRSLAPGEFRPIEVRVNAPGAKVQAVEGYEVK